MTKHGALKLKRNKNILFLKKIALICGISFMFMTGCKTIPQVTQKPLNPVYTFDILDDEGAMYIHIPASENRDLLEVIVSGFFKGLSDSDAKMLVSKVDNVFASFGSRKDKRRIQLAVDGNIPSMLPSALKSNGYSETKYVAKSLYEGNPDSLSTYYIFESPEMQVGVASPTQIAISKNVKGMLDSYNCERDAINEIGGQVILETRYLDDWKSTDLYKWISEDVPSIHFYIVRPQAFLSNLIGSDMSSKVFKLVYAKGNFSKLSNAKYELTLDLEFQNSKYVKPAVSILILTMGLTDSDVKTISPTHVQLSGVHLNTKQLVDMLGL